MKQRVVASLLVVSKLQVFHIADYFSLAQVLYKHEQHRMSLWTWWKCQNKRGTDVRLLAEQQVFFQFSYVTSQVSKWVTWVWLEREAWDSSLLLWCVFTLFIKPTTILHWIQKQQNRIRFEMQRFLSAFFCSSHVINIIHNNSIYVLYLHNAELDCIFNPFLQLDYF